MGKLFASLLAMIPLVAAAQDAAQPPAQPSEPQYAPPPQQAPPPAQQPPQYPPQYAPPPQYTPPPPQGQSAPPQQYAPPPPYVPGQNPPAQAYRRAPYQRDSWYIGFGFGGGDGQITDAAGTASFKEFLGKSPTTLALNFKVGATLTPRLLLGLDMSGVSSSASDSGATATLTVVNYDGVATFFPIEHGFFVRGGVGLSRMTVDVTSSFISGSVDYSGTNVTGGIGYAWWLGRTFNLTANLDYSAQFWGDNNGGTTGPQRSSFWALGLGFDWY